MTLSDKLANDPLYLYKELGKIGRRRIPLTPTSLLSYETLLHCSEVNRRVAGRKVVTDLQRAEAAHNAILDAIRWIPEPPERRIAEAVLGSVKPFIGERVIDRKKTLAKEGIGYDMFKEKRPTALGQVVDYLEGRLPQDNSMLPPVLSPEARELPEGVAHVFHELTGAAANLHYAALACVFVSRIDDRFGQENITVQRHPVESPVPEASYFSNCLFMAIGYLEDRRYSLERNFLQWDTAHLPMHRQRTLWFMINTIDQISPLNTPQRADLSYFASLIQQGREPDKNHQDSITELFETVWTPWFAHNAPASGTTSTSGIEIIAAKSAAILGIVKEAVGVSQAIEYETFHRYYVLLEAYYSDADLTIDDKSMPEYIEHYLKSEMENLATSEIIWLNSESNRSKQRWPRIKLTAPKHEAT
jgi:hypothetical protein